MPADKVAEAVQKAQEAFRTEVTETYELDEEFVDSLVEMFTKHSTPLTEVAPKRSRASKASGDKPRRKKSAYNVFVREKMATDEIKTVPHKEKMSHIAALWAEVTDDEKEEFKAKANEENKAAETAEVTA